MRQSSKSVGIPILHSPLAIPKAYATSHEAIDKDEAFMEEAKERSADAPGSRERNAPGLG